MRLPRHHRREPSVAAGVQQHPAGIGGEDKVRPLLGSSSSFGASVAAWRPDRQDPGSAVDPLLVGALGVELGFLLEEDRGAAVEDGLGSLLLGSCFFFFFVVRCCRRRCCSAGPAEAEASSACCCWRSTAEVEGARGGRAEEARRPCGGRRRRRAEERGRRSGGRSGRRAKVEGGRLPCSRCCCSSETAKQTFGSCRNSCRSTCGRGGLGLLGRGLLLFVSSFAAAVCRRRKDVTEFLRELRGMLAVGARARSPERVRGFLLLLRDPAVSLMDVLGWRNWDGRRDEFFDGINIDWSIDS